MLLFLLTLATILMGGWVFTAIISGIDDGGKVTQSHRVLNKKISLWSLLFLIFFPECNVTGSYRLPPQELN